MVGMHARSFGQASSSNPASSHRFRMRIPFLMWVAAHTEANAFLSTSVTWAMLVQMHVANGNPTSLPPSSNNRGKEKRTSRIASALIASLLLWTGLEGKKLKCCCCSAVSMQVHPPRGHTANILQGPSNVSSLVASTTAPCSCKCEHYVVIAHIVGPKLGTAVQSLLINH